MGDTPAGLPNYTLCQKAQANSVPRQPCKIMHLPETPVLFALLAFLSATWTGANALLRRPRFTANKPAQPFSSSWDFPQGMLCLVLIISKYGALFCVASLLIKLF